MKAILVNNNNGIYSRNYSAEIEDWEDVMAEMSGHEVIAEEALTGWEDDDGDWSRAVTYGNTVDGYYSEVTYFVED